MRPVPASAVGSVPATLVARADAALAHRVILADVLRWAREQMPPRTVSEIVTQDEYTHDIVLPFEGEYFLAFDAT
jgi:hypothetical protein